MNYIHIRKKETDLWVCDFNPEMVMMTHQNSALALPPSLGNFFFEKHGTEEFEAMLLLDGEMLPMPDWFRPSK